MERCYLCNHKTHIFLNIKKKLILRCGNCKLTYTRDVSSNHGIIREDSEKFVKEYLKEARYYKEYFNNIIELILKYTKPRSVLDVGCGIGIFLQSAKNIGLKAVGVDMSAQAIEYARSYGHDARLGKIEELSFRPRTFDVITLFQTIEHIEDPLTLLKKIYSLLKRGGILVITTPNEESFMARLMGRFWFGYRNIEHMYFYNKKSLAGLQRRVGFKKIKIHSENGRLLSMEWVLIRIFEYYYTRESTIASLVLKTRDYWKYLNRITFREPDVNLVSVAVK